MKNPFHKRMKLEEEFLDESEIRKVSGRDELKTADDEEFAQLIEGIRV